MSEAKVFIENFNMSANGIGEHGKKPILFKYTNKDDTSEVFYPLILVEKATDNSTVYLSNSNTSVVKNETLKSIKAEEDTAETDECSADAEESADNMLAAEEPEEDKNIYLYNGGTLTYQKLTELIMHSSLLNEDTDIIVRIYNDPTNNDSFSVFKCGEIEYTDTSVNIIIKSA